MSHTRTGFLAGSPGHVVLRSAMMGVLDWAYNHGVPEVLTFTTSRNGVHVSSRWDLVEYLEGRHRVIDGPEAPPKRGSMTEISSVVRMDGNWRVIHRGRIQRVVLSGPDVAGKLLDDLIKGLAKDDPQ